MILGTLGTLQGWNLKEGIQLSEPAAFEDQMYIASIESPGLIFRIPLDDLNSRELLYKNDNPIVFLDAMAFTDDGIGIVMGDPQNECITYH